MEFVAIYKKLKKFRIEFGIHTGNCQTLEESASHNWSNISDTIHEQKDSTGS